MQILPSDRHQLTMTGFKHTSVLALLLFLGSLPSRASARSESSRGEYLTTILGCGGCHTEGALLGNPTGGWLTGSRIGVAYTGDDIDGSPGVIFQRT